MAAATTHQFMLIFLICSSPLQVLSYKLSTVDAPGVCNETIYLEDGAQSAAILRLTSKDYYDTSPLNCIITFKAAQSLWSGLTGVLEEVDLRRYEDTADHHLAQNQCVDFIKVLDDTAMPQDEQCGSWSVAGSDKLSPLGSRRSLFGYCQTLPAPGSHIQCGVRELRVQVSVGARDFSNLMKGKPWRSHRGFTFVVTAYQYSYGERGCRDNLQSCRKMDYHGYQQHCVHKSLWCDNHINCGQLENTDEMNCHNDEMLSGLVTVMVGPWVGAALLVVLVLVGVLFWRRARPNPPPGPPPPQDHNSYAESYEVSSTMSSAHHMAIQVRVVCNSGHGLHTPRLSPWQAADLPPSYDSLFPQGPPPPKTTATTTIANGAASSSTPGFNISTTSLVSTSIGSNANSAPGPSGFYSNTTQTSSIVIPISAICNTLESSAASSASYSTITTANTVTSCTPTITNTTTSTTTISSVGASPAAMASISVTSVSLAGPSDKVSDNQNKDSSNPSPSHYVTRSNNSIPAVSHSNILSKSDRESSRMLEGASPPQCEPENVDITPNGSANDTTNSEDNNSPYQSRGAGQCTESSDPPDSSTEQACDTVSLSSTVSKTAAQQDTSEYNTGENMSQPSTMSASCTDFEISERQDSESEETEEVTLEDEELSKAATVSVDEEQNLRHTPSATSSTEESTRPLSLHEMREERLTNEHSLDKDDESLL